MAWSKTKQISKIVVLFSLIFLFKIYLCQFGNQKNDDLIIHLDWAQTLHTQGTKNFYAKQVWNITPATQPPLINLLFKLSQSIYNRKYFLAQLHNLIKIPPTFIILWFDKFGPFITLKLWPILSDFLSAFFIYKLIQKLTKNNQSAFRASIFFLLNPLTIFESSIWGQNDVLAAFFATLSIFLIKSNYLIAPIIFAISILIKPTTFILAPLFIFLYIKIYPSIKKILLSLFVTLSFSLATFLPFVQLNKSTFFDINQIIFKRIAPSSKGVNLASVSAFNLFSAIFTIDKTPAWQKIGIINISNFSIILLFIFLAILYKHLLFQKIYTTTIAIYIFLTSQIFFIFSTSMLERYFFPGFIASSFLLFSIKDRKNTILILSQYLIHFINLIYAFNHRHVDLVRNIFLTPDLILIRLISIANVIVTFQLFKKLLKFNKKLNKLEYY